MKKNKHNSLAFTLIEILIVVAITALLSSFVIIYGSMGRSITTLLVEKAKLTSLILRAKSLAVTTLASQTSATTDPPCGYGVNIDYTDNSYSVFAYQKDSSSGRCLPLVDSSDNLFPTRIVALPNSTYQLENGIDFIKNADSLDTVLFLPPEPRTLLFPQISLAEEKIYLHGVNGGPSGVISVSEVGQVNLE